MLLLPEMRANPSQGSMPNQRPKTPQGPSHRTMGHAPRGRGAAQCAQRQTLSEEVRWQGSLAKEMTQAVVLGLPSISATPRRCRRLNRHTLTRPHQGLDGGLQGPMSAAQPGSQAPQSESPIPLKYPRPLAKVLMYRPPSSSHDYAPESRPSPKYYAPVALSGLPAAMSSTTSISRSLLCHRSLFLRLFLFLESQIPPSPLTHQTNVRTRTSYRLHDSVGQPSHRRKRQLYDLDAGSLTPSPPN